MHTNQLSNSHVSTALRARTADFFKMDLPHAVSVTPPKDCNPLRRNLNKFDRMEAWETNENMCFALWELMSRS